MWWFTGRKVKRHSGSNPGASLFCRSAKAWAPKQQQLVFSTKLKKDYSNEFCLHDWGHGKRAQLLPRRFDNESHLRPPFLFEKYVKETGNCPYFALKIKALCNELKSSKFCYIFSSNDPNRFLDLQKWSLSTSALSLKN